jgi:hypothetical protein
MIEVNLNFKKFLRPNGNGVVLNCFFNKIKNNHVHLIIIN